MSANRVLIGSVALVLVALVFFSGTATGAPLGTPGQAPGSNHCLALIRQELGTVLPTMSADDEAQLCSTLGQPAGVQPPTTGGSQAIYPDEWMRDGQVTDPPTTGGNAGSCVASVRQQLGTVWPRMDAAQEAAICASSK